ncbi:polyketide cyclase, partial [Pseudomonas prosekii]
MSELQLHPKAAQSLSQWHTMIRTGDLKALPSLLAPDAV